MQTAVFSSLYHHYTRGIKWNGLASSCYQVVLILHNLFLFKVIGYQNYGFIGAYFSYIFIAVRIFNFGFDATLAPYYVEISRDKYSFKLFIYQYAVPQIIFASLLTFAILVSFSIMNPLKYLELLSDTSVTFRIMIGSTVIIEMIKRTLKYLLQLGFCNKSYAAQEMKFIIGYVLLIWISYAAGKNLNPTFILGMFGLISLINLYYIFYLVYNWYEKLPSHPSRQHYSLDGFYLQQWYNGCNKLSSSFFTGNFLIPLITIHSGLYQASILKLCSYMLYGVSTVLKDMFGYTAEAVFAQLVFHIPSTQQAIFHQINKKVCTLLLLIFIFFIIGIKPLFTFFDPTYLPLSWTLIYLFITIIFLENFFILYEKYLSATKRSHLLLFTNMSTTALLFLACKIPYALSSFFLLTTITLIRCCSLALFVVIVQKVLPMLHKKRTNNFAA